MKAVITKPRSVCILLVLAALETGFAGTTVIRAARAFTGQEIVENVCIVIDGDRIRDLIPMEDFNPIDGSVVIDAAGTTVSPGFIDSHVHVLSMPIQYLQNIPRYGWGRLAEQMNSRVPRNRREFLESGITAVFDMGAPIDSVAGMGRDLAAGTILGPDLYYGGPLFTAPGGHPAGTIYRGRHSLIDTATVQVSAPGPALRNGVIAHVGAAESCFADMIGIGVDGIEHCFAFDGSDAVFRQMASRGIAFTPTLSIYELYAPQVMPRMQESVRRAFAQGVSIAAGTDFPSTRFMNASEGYFRELALLEQAGLPRIDVLRAATTHAARKLGKEGEVGSLAPGCAANIVLVDGDIREGALTRDRVRTVMLHGKVVFEDRELADGLQKGFARKSFVVSPYGFYDPVAAFSVGLNVIGFNLLDTGVAASLNAAYSFSNHFGAELSVSPPSPIPGTSLGAAFHFDNYPRRFFGLGNDSVLGDALVYGSTGVQASVSTTTAFARTFDFSTQFSIDYRATEGMGGQPVPAVTGGDGGIVTMVGMQIAHDGRDAPAAPWYGDYEAVSIGFSHPFLGSDYAFETLGVDLRCFLSIAHGHVVAARVLYRQTFGDAPFYYRPDFGGSVVGRGFQPGRFIGDIALTGQLEYRFPIWTIIGGVLFVDAGQVRDEFPAFTLDGIHLTGGAGIRFAFSETSILAFDLGFTGEPLSDEGYSIVFRYRNAF
ncbi:MAG: amidohydrolase family protein [Bacteroidetes bacterium]|nr:amidohydrolase family protein [Bacteroidota bacterium]